MKKTILLAVALLTILGTRVNAVTIPYGDFTGDNVMFLDVTEDTRLEPSALFGAPQVLGDSLDFDPVTFFAQANSSGAGDFQTEIVDGQLNFTVMGINNFPIESVLIQERGDYTLAGTTTNLATASVVAPVVWNIIEVDGSPVTPIPGGGNLVFSPTSGNYSTAVGDASDNWTGVLDIDVAAFLSGQGINGSATKIEFALDNTLSVTANDGATAFITKKDSGVTITVPEPNSALLILGGLFGLIGTARRRR